MAGYLVYSLMSGEPVEDNLPNAILHAENRKDAQKPFTIEKFCAPPELQDTRTHTDSYAGESVSAPLFWLLESHFLYHRF